MGRRGSVDGRGRRRVIGAGSAVGAFLALGLTAPAAHTDDLGLDAVTDTVAGGLGGARIDPSDPDVGAAPAGVVDPAVVAGSNPADSYQQFYLALNTGVRHLITGLAPLWDVVNLPTVLLVGRDLIGNGLSIGQAIPLIGGTWDGVNHSLLGGLLGDFL
ncbi:MAG TPA: hypothetical protein VFR27_07485, partial [Mycobacterium sp.]|nr:hypothetical protein [Mycobacterium sp.]